VPPAQKHRGDVRNRIVKQSRTIFLDKQKVASRPSRIPKRAPYPGIRAVRKYAAFAYTLFHSDLCTTRDDDADPSLIPCTAPLTGMPFSEALRVLTDFSTVSNFPKTQKKEDRKKEKRKKKLL